MAYKPNELIFWQLSDGDTWKLQPKGLGVYLITNETSNCLVAQDKTLDQAKDLVRLADKTIVEEI